MAESCGWGALAANVGPLGRPGGYQRPTLGQPTVNVRSTYGQPSVSSLAISGRFSLILQVSSIKTEDKRTCICKMVDFPIRKWDFRVCGWSGAFWEPLERKKEKTKCIYKILIPLHRSTLKYLSIFRFYFCNFLHQISSFFANFESISRVFEQILMKICRNFTGLKNASQNFGEISNFDELGVRGLPKKLK